MSERVRIDHQARRAALCLFRAGPIGLALSVAALAVVLLPGHARAQGTLIDDFSVGQPRASSVANGAESASLSEGQAASITGGERDVAVTRLGGAADASVDVFPDPGTLAYSTGGGGTFGRATIVWDGDDNAAGTDSIDFDGLQSLAAPVDLTFGGLTDQLDIKTTSGDTLELTVRITLYANAGTSASIQRTQANGNKTLSFRFTDFTITGDPAAFDITNVGAIRLDLITSAVSPGLDVDLDFVQASSSVIVTMVDQVLDSAGNPKDGPAGPGDTIRYTVTIENPDDPAGLASAPLEFRFDPALSPTSGLTALNPGTVNIPNIGGVGATVGEGNDPADTRVVVTLPPIPDRAAGGSCGTDNTVAGCASFTFDVVVGQTLPPELLRVIGGQTFIPAQGTLTSVVPDGINTTLLTNDPDVLSPPRSDGPPRENLTQVALCGNGVVDVGEGCDNPGGDPGDFCTDDCRIRSVEECPEGQSCPAPGCTPGAENCPVCNDDPPGAGDGTCESGFCNDGVCQRCGNNVLEAGEGCDDGNVTSGDGCNASCLIESIEVVGNCPLGDCPDTVTSCTEGSPGCPACNTMSPGQTGDDSCASGFCNADGFCQDCGDGDLDGFEGCDDMNNAGTDGCSATCLIESCPADQSCPVAPDCTPGAPGCNACNEDPDGATGDASCESDYCDPDTNTCGPRLPRLGGGGCAATTADAGFGLGLMMVMVMGWLLRRRRSAIGAIAILAVAFPPLARAQEDDSRNFSAERFKLSSDRDGILDVESGTVIGHLNWDLGFWLGYADDPLALYMEDGGERIDSFLTRRIGGELVAAVGFGERLQLGVQIPVILDQNYTYMDAALEPESSAGLGDVSIHPKLQILFARSHGVDLAIIPAFTLPSRGSESYFGDVSLSFAPMLAASRRINRIGLGGNLGYRLRYNTPEVLGLEVVDEAFARLGASYRLNNDAEKPLDLGLSLSLSTAAADLFGLFNRNHAEGLLGANYQVTSDWNLFGGGGVGLNPGFGTPDWRVLAGLRFTKRPLVCEQPLIARNGRCVKDCPAPYVDRGGECALPECKEGYDRVGDECMLRVQCDGNPPNKDADCDTLPAPPWIQLGPPDEAYDKKRTEPKPPGEPVDPTGYKFGDTVPVEEGKQDFPESVTEYDYCPTVPGKVEHHGCPPPSVVVNECAEGKARGSITVGPEIAFLPGSPILTLPSRVPLEEMARVVARSPDLLVAINVGGPKADQALAQGRADAIAAFLQKNGVKVDNVSIVGTGVATGAAADAPANYPVSFERRCPANLPPTTLCKNIELGDDYKIDFEVNSDVIRPASKEMLKRDVQWLLEAHPQVRVEIQGHTSGEGRLQYNMDLSRRRAQAVVAYLVSQGIAANRLSAVGHGPKIPLVSPEKTESDREKNRRIEFSIRPRKECNTCTRFEVGKIQFEFNSGVIKAESFPELDSVVRKLLAAPEVHLLIEGHTSSEGAANYNRRLSGVRAAAVRKYLIEKGVPQARLDSKGVGEDRLLVPNDATEEQKEKNRRVEFTITKGKPECPE
jgi:uncharacterized protein (TIGR03382 family)